MKEIVITSSVLILALTLLRQIFGKKVSRCLVYGAWILVALRLLIPIQIGQLEFSVLSRTQQLSETITEISDLRVAGRTETDAHKQVIEEYIEKDMSAFTPQIQEQIKEDLERGDSAEDVAVHLHKIYNDSDIFTEELQPQVQQQVKDITDPVTLGQAAKVIWLMGVAVMAAWFMIVNISYSRKIRCNARKLDVDTPIGVYVSEQVGSPCLVGVFSPRVYLTPECEQNENIQRHVLTHELTHYAHKDHLWSFVRCACLCIYWFHPLVWLAAFLSRRDCELACDEGALKRLGEADRFSYGEALLAVVDHSSARNRLMQTATTMNETKQQLKERVNFIVKQRKLSLAAAIAMILICAIVAGCAGAGAQNQEGQNQGDSSGNTTSSQPSEVLPEGPRTYYLLTEEMRWVSDGLPYYRNTYTYDNMGRMLSHEFELYELEDVINGRTYLETFTYNDQGHLITMQTNEEFKQSWEYTYTYDEQGKVISYARREVGSNKDSYVVNFEYDTQGRLVRAYRNNQDEDMMTCTYDEAGNPIKVQCIEDSLPSTLQYDSQTKVLTYFGSSIAYYSFDANGCLIQEDNRSEIKQWNYHYGDGVLTGVEFTTEIEAEYGEFAKREYVLDENGNITAVLLANGSRTEYTYQAIQLERDEADLRYVYFNLHNEALALPDYWRDMLSFLLPKALAE